jgi:hypothetical protein
LTVQVFACEIEGEMGLDVAITDPNATVFDLLAAMQWATDDPRIVKPFHRQRYARCEACVNNCCKHNYITPDLVSANALAAHLGMDLSRFAHKYLCLSPDVPYPEFKHRPCPFLIANRCSVYEHRSLICRLYLCTPMSDRLEQLRAAVSFAGEAALKQQLLQLGLGPPTWSARLERQTLRQRLQRDEISQQQWRERSEQLGILWEHNPFLPGQSYQDVRLADCCTDFLWQQLTSDNRIS